jgi:hypothetical protein
VKSRVTVPDGSSRFPSMPSFSRLDSASHMPSAFAAFALSDGVIESSTASRAAT